MEIPSFWKSELSDIDNIVGKIKKGKVTSIKSAGGRPVYFIEYGKRNDLKRCANYSSACGAGALECYADKSGKDIRPTIFLVGAMHGAEIEGTVALLNLISIIETGKDLAGNLKPELSALAEKANLLIIPCANPDGRARFPRESAVGMTTEEFRYYAQGTWKDGTLCNWPDCKKVHPIKDASEYMGAYYNDDGINMMHDNFSFPMAEETKLVLKTADEYAPDITLLLHGCAGAKSELLMPKAVHKYFKDEAYKFSEELVEICEKENLRHTLSKPLYGDDEPVHAYNIVSAITNLCGELCVVYECNQGLSDSPHKISYDEMYKQHIALFSLAGKYAAGRL